MVALPIRRIQFLSLMSVCCLVLLCPVNAQASWWWPFGHKGLDYTIHISGVNTEMTEWFSSLKLDKPTETRPPEKPDELSQESVALGERLRKALSAKGYFDAVVQSTVETNHKPPVLRYTISPGKRYTVGTMAVQWPGKPLLNVPVSTLKSKRGQPVDAALIQDDALTIVKQIDAKTCLLYLDVTPVLELSAGSHKADLRFRVNHGDQARFGRSIITGTQKVKDKVILRSVSWTEGECFKRSKIESTQTSLIQNQLFSSVVVTPAQHANKAGEAPITIAVKERVPRTITAGINYGTDQGFGVTTGWEHRNFFGGAEKFNADLVLAQQEQSLNTNLRIPAFLRNDQVLALNGGIKRQNTDAYTTNSVTTGATVERRLTPKLNSGLGVAYTLTQTDDVLGSSSQYGLLSFPGFLNYDTRDNTLDARKGVLGNLTVTPYSETFGEGGRFIKTQMTGQAYFSSDVKFKPTLALKLTVGSIMGAEGQDVPSDIRFYAGGGGSVRGYSYQALSPRVNGEPVGGSSMVVATTEARFRFTDTIGGVAFIDAGNAYEDEMPQIGQDMYYGAGVGARYYSPIGPLRVDVAVPLNGDDIGETGYGLYVSLGQAF